MVTKRYFIAHKELIIACSQKKDFTLHDIKHIFDNNLNKTRGAIQAMSTKGILISTKHPYKNSKRYPNTHNLSTESIHQMKKLNYI